MASSLSRSRAIVAALFALLSLPTSTVSAQTKDFPNKPINLVIPYGPGSGGDTLSRSLAQALTAEYRVPVIIDNKAGASGFIAAQQAVRAAPDGYTLFLGGTTTHSANPNLFKKLPYDPVADFTPISLLSKGYMVFLVRPSLGVKSVQEFIELAKKSPQELRFGSGSGSARLTVEMFSQMTGIKFLHIPYKTNPLVITDLIGGHLDFMFVDANTAVPLTAAGKLLPIAVTSKKRLSQMASVPTMEEAGIKGFEWTFWLGMYAPAGVDAATVRRLNEMMRKAVDSAAYKAYHDSISAEPVASSPEELARAQAEDTRLMRRVIQTAGIPQE
ncbi:MAG: tripartite tricarboxylate transporter substrate binding protein [Rubrivivax sp.]